MDKAEQARERAKAWYAANKERAKAARATYYQNNKDAAKARAKRHAAKNRATIRVVNSFRYAADPERYRGHQRAWAKRHPEKHADKQAKRRAKLNGVTVEHVSRELIYYRDKMKCYICKTRIDFADMHLDHVIPLAKGGKHSNDNCRCACATCNLKKGAK